jgi:sigma-B regulation protein RsbU (phosphoserine phosphatase)
MISAFWRPEARTLRLANAGLPLPIICSGGHVTEKKVEGVPLGLLPDITYEEVTVTLEPGDAVLICSDGITDNRDEFGQEYGRDRLVDLVGKHWRLPAEALIHKIFQDVKTHAAGTPAFDDQTIAVLKVR